MSTAGRVFFTYQGRTASCSGNAVTSADKSTVPTAGHCVKLEGAWHANWAFVPGHHDGQAPYGRWTGGASGGPWFTRFDEATGTGLQSSVNSFTYNFLPNRMYGPCFGTDAQVPLPGRAVLLRPVRRPLPAFDGPEAGSRMQRGGPGHRASPAADLLTTIGRPLF
ncbi:hypothetical protein SsS58_00279 [Streptomyces scabiei]|uniref:Secreted protein n=1 Tax=Streptomyces scabiei TaxID=1930 RepID=A0A100JI23_STRSC|nr:hypothetical protein SsS58_00279 [Streptomyces scabiei]